MQYNIPQKFQDTELSVKIFLIFTINGRSAVSGNSSSRVAFHQSQVLFLVLNKKIIKCTIFLMPIHVIWLILCLLYCENFENSHCWSGKGVFS